jgi:hypothetical protein
VGLPDVRYRIQLQEQPQSLPLAVVGISSSNGRKKGRKEGLEGLEGRRLKNNEGWVAIIILTEAISLCQ